MNLRSIDLNLLVVLDALLEERSVSRAGERVGLSQSATSHALDRLRKLLGDDLFVRGSGGMEPTERALAMAGPLRETLQTLSAALDPLAFDPAQAEDAFTIAVETYETIRMLPRIVDLVRSTAPGLQISIRSGLTAEIAAGVDQGTIDVGIGIFENLPDRFMARRLLADDHVCVMRRDHPLSTGPLGLDAYLGAPHLLVSMSGATEGAIDRILAEQRLQRRIAMRLPHGLAAVIALARSDMVATVTRGAAHVLAEAAPLVARDLPFACPPTEFRMIWNRRRQQSPAHGWLRRMLAGIAAEVEAARGPIPILSRRPD